MKWLAQVTVGMRQGAGYLLRGHGLYTLDQERARTPVCKPQPCHSPAMATVPTENILKRDTCDPPFGDQTTVPKELEFPQESPAGSRKRQTLASVRGRAEMPHCSDDLSDHLAGGTGSEATIDRSGTHAQARPSDGDSLFKPEPQMSVPNQGLGGAVTGLIYLFLFPRLPL